VNGQNGHFERVKAGDLITDDLMNRILDKLDSLEARVSKLEVVGPGGSVVAITDIFPAGSLQIGQEVQVLGRNFVLPVTLNTVSVDGIIIQGFNPGSDNTRLIFNIPAIQGAPKDVILKITNQNGRDFRTINILPSSLSGNIDVSWLSVTPQTITQNQPATFLYQLESRATAPAKFTISPVVSIPSWQSNLQVLDSSLNIIPSGQIELAPLQQKQFNIRINPIPDGTNGTNFSLLVDVSAQGLMGSSGPRNFTVGQAAQQPDSSITFTRNFVNPSSALIPGTGTNPDTIQLKQGTTATVGLSAVLTVAGTYDVTILPAPLPTGWSIAPTFDSPAEFTVNPGDLSAVPVAKTPKYTVSPQAGAASSRIEIHIKRQGASSDQFIPFALALLQ